MMQRGWAMVGKFLVAIAILFMAVVVLGPVFDSLGLPPDAGAATSGHRLDAVPAALGMAE